MQTLTPSLFGPTIQGRFEEYHRKHPEVYNELVRLARSLRDKGVERYGIAALFEVLRYDRAISTSDDAGWKLCNDYRSRYARLIESNESDLRGFFAVRMLKSA